MEERVKDLEKFVDMTDVGILEEIKMKAAQVKEDPSPEEEDLLKARDILERLLRRDLWKVVLEMPFSIEGIDPTLVSRSLAVETLEKMRSNIKKALERDVDPEDEEILRRLYENFDDMFVVDTPYKLTLVHPDEFLQSKVLIYDGKEILDFDDYVKKYPAYKLMTSNLIQIVRIYITEDLRWILRKYSIVPEERIRMVTRW